MPIASDISVAANGNIRWTGSGTTAYTVLELHRFLQDLADAATSSGDDLLDITSSNPSTRKTDNIIQLNGSYNIDDTLAQHLYNGSISQTSGDVLYAGLTVVGSVYDAATQLQIVQNNALLTNYWTTGLNVDAANNILLRILVKVRTGGADIDGKRLRVQARELGSSYAEFSLTMAEGISVAAISTVQDLNNGTAAGTIAGWSDINNVEGFQTIDLGNGAGPREYYSKWDRASRTINQTYERTKWIQRRGSATTIYGMNGELFRGITHQIPYDTEGGGGSAFTQNEIISWGSGATAGTAALLALDDDGSTGNLYVQLLTGVICTDNLTMTGGTSGRTALVNGTPTARTISPAFFGQSTGTAIIGAYGVGVETADLTSNDKLFDLSNTQQTPPNIVTFTVAGLVSGEDRVIVGPKDTGDAIKFDQLAAAAGNTAGNATLVVSTSIPTDTPTSGTVRAYNGTSYDRIPYTSYSGSTFTLTGTLTNTIATSANVFVSYIDDVAAASTATFTAVFLSNRDLWVKVRDGGVTPIVPFETSATLTSGGGSVTAIRQADV